MVDVKPILATHKLDSQISLYQYGKKSTRILQIGAFDYNPTLIFLMANPESTVIGIEPESDLRESSETINSHFNNRFTLINGNLRRVIPTLTEKFDLIYIMRELSLSETTEVIELCRMVSKIESVLYLSDDQMIETYAILDSHSNLLKREMKNIWSWQPEAFVEVKTTIVTMLYDIRTIEGTTQGHIQRIDKYIENGKSLMNLGHPTIFFTEESLVSKIRAIAGSHVKIIVQPFDQTYFYKDLDRLRELQRNYPIINADPAKDTPLYVILNNNKFFFLEKAIEMNPFGSTHFAWIDFGITHVVKDLPVVKSWINRVPDKIRQMVINPYVPTESEYTYFKFIYHNMAGGLFTGSRESMLEYSRLFKARYDSILDNGMWQLDEAVMGLVYYENPDLFVPFCGDYVDLAINYSSHNASLYIIQYAIQKYINGYKHYLASKLLKYLKSTLLYHRDLKFYLYHSHIICDYYLDESHRLDPDIVNAIQWSLEFDHEKTENFLRESQGNLKFYTNVSQLLL